ncbi:unnamed protein product [Ranitomeya imitator]|uniref:steroid 11beta-monooxygenase n=1 Tax=Ranitomeya imitator TaxID=111125 RepID=A0ABN9LTV3_9NEOB|nr:unnamed protein product [Ranitomeya imitator]
MIGLHVKQVRMGFPGPGANSLFVKGSKCLFGVQKVLKSLQKFLGFANFYRCFICNFSSIAKPLTDLTKKGADLVNWSSAAVEAFQELKRRFSSAPVLCQPDVSLPFQVEVDASEIGAGAVLSQRGSGCSVLKPCAFFSRKFSAAERNYDVGNRELLAMKWAFEEWRHWLEGAKHRVVVLTDHKNLTYLESAKRLNPRQARWSLFFARFDFVILYLPGSKNVKADALSRSFVPDSPGSSEPASILKEGVIVSAISLICGECCKNFRRINLIVVRRRNCSSLIGGLTNGQTERTNQTLETYLRCFVSADQDDWVSFLPLAEFALNNRASSATLVSPFFCNSGFHPRFSSGQVESSDCPGVDSVVDRLQRIWTQVVDNLTLSQEKAQLFANRRRCVGPRLRVGDLVWLSSRHIPMKVSSPKFKPHFIGPYRISEILNPVSFRLTLPDSFSIHNVFHRSLLRRYVAPMVPSVEPPAPVLVEGELEYIVEKILDSRVSRRKLQYLVKWKGYAQEDNSWVFASDVHAPDLVRAFHVAHPGRPGGSACQFVLLEALRRKGCTAVPLVRHASSYVLYGQRLGLLEEHPNQESLRFISAVEMMIKTTLPLIYFPYQLMRLSDSRIWREHMKSWDIIFEQADRCIQNIYQEFCLGQERGYSGIMAELLLQGELPLDSIKANITELMAGGVDTTAMPLLFTLFELARNPSVQRELRDEVRKAEAQNPQDLNQLLNLMPLLKGAIKETLRLYPVGITVQRYLTKDITLHNYHIPSGTLVQVGLYPMGRSSHIFQDPQRYDPGRWMRRDDTNFKALAFGFGSRQCIGRRIAETEMMLFLMHMLKNFQIDTVCKHDLNTVFRFILMPEKPPLLTFRPI